MKKLLFTLAVGICAFACSDDDNNKNDNTNSSASINGTTFTPTETKALDFEQGIEIKLRDGLSEITLRTESNSGGTYTIKNSSPQVSGRITGVSEAMAEYVNEDGEVFYATEGDISFSLKNGKASGTFSFNAESLDKDISVITDGKFSEIEIASLSSLECLPLINGASYNADGNMVSFGYTGDKTYISYYNKKPVSFLTVSGYGNNIEYAIGKIEYSDNKVISIDIEYKSASCNDCDDDETSTFSYDDLGKLITITTNYGDSEEVQTLSYSGDNLTKLDRGDIEYLFGEYDTKNNPLLLITKALDNQPALGHHFFGSLTISKNNPTITSREGFDPYTETRQYQYNDMNYPITISVSRDGDNPQVSSITYTCD